MNEDENTDQLIEMEDSQITEPLMEICPVCGSLDLYYESGGVEGLYHCKKCGYIGSFVINANEEMVKTIQEEYKKNT